MSHAKLEVRMESLLPFLQGTCTPYNMPVYPGAQCEIANALPNALIDRSNRSFIRRLLISIKFHNGSGLQQVSI
jgi:hypothetical protein